MERDVLIAVHDYVSTLKAFVKEWEHRHKWFLAVILFSRWFEESDLEVSNVIEDSDQVRGRHISVVARNFPFCCSRAHIVFYRMAFFDNPLAWRNFLCFTQLRGRMRPCQIGIFLVVVSQHTIKFLLLKLRRERALRKKHIVHRHFSERLRIFSGLDMYSKVGLIKGLDLRENSMSWLITLSIRLRGEFFGVI